MTNSASLTVSLNIVASWDERRTTFMISNLPYQTTISDLREALEASEEAQFDLLYLPWDEERSYCRGIAFVNLTNTDYLVSFVADWQGRHWGRNILRLSFARIQGLPALLKEHQPLIQGPAAQRAPRLHVVVDQDAAEPQ